MPTFNSISTPEPPPFKLDNFAGINLAVTPTQIADNESPDMLNITLDTRGQPDKRTGYFKVYENSLGAGQINGMFRYKKLDGTTIFLIHHGTKLYTQSDEYANLTWNEIDALDNTFDEVDSLDLLLNDNHPIEIYSGLANAKSKYFVMNDKCYILDGTNYITYDGTTVSAVVGYIPTVLVGSGPSGGGNVLEDFNLIQPGFKVEFSSVAGQLTYTLPYSGLDATPVTATLNGVAKTETTHFTVNRTNGTVTLLADPGNGTDNFIVTAYKTQTGFADRVKKCTNLVIFGGSNDTRVHISGQDNIVRHCGLDDPTYWPENGYDKAGSDSAKVVGFAKQYDYCLVIKEAVPNDSPIWMMNFELDTNGEATFPVKPINDSVGCYAPNTIQVLDNDPTFLDRTGLWQVKASNIRDERNVQQVSTKIDPALLNESNLQNAVSVDFNNKYYIAVNGKVYVYDYKYVNPLTNEQGAWFPWDNIPASCFLEMDGYLYFGSSSAGLVYKFKKKTDSVVYNDDGVAINAYIYTKQLDFGAPERWKIVNMVDVALKPDSATSADVYYISDKKASPLIKTVSMNTFDFRNINFAQFTFILGSFPKSKKVKVKAKKITYFQLLFKNNRLNENMSLLSASVLFNYQGYSK